MNNETQQNDANRPTYGNDDAVKKISGLLGGEPDSKPDADKKETVKADQHAEAGDPQAERDPFDLDIETKQVDDPHQADSIDEEALEHVTLKDLAAELEIEAKDLYEVEIPMGADKAISLGELKDAYKKFEHMQRDQDDYQETKSRSENELMVARRQLEQLIQLGSATGQLTPELISALDNQHTQNIQREHLALIQAIPEWNDQARKTNDFEKMVNVMQGYGFSRTEVESVMDHRLVKFVHDMTQRINLVQEAKKRKKIPASLGKSKPGHKSKSSALQQRIQRAKTGTSTEKVQAISSLIT